MNVIGYARVSTSKQELARQRDKIKNFCAEKNYNLIEIIEDFGISGATNNRNGYLRLKSLTSADCDLIVTSEMSRLSRQEDITETLNDLQSIIKNGISLTILDNKDKLYPANEVFPIQDILILVIQLYGAAQERNEIKRKNQDGKNALLRQYPYIVVDAKIPYGFKKVRKNNRYFLEEEPSESVNIRKLFQLVLSGYSLYKCADYFNERNISFRGNAASVYILSLFLHSDIYRGIRTRKSSYGKEKPEIITVNIEPIIPEEDFLKAAELIKINNKSISRSIKHFNPLKGIMKCRCGRSMMIKDKKPSGKSKYTYRCSCTETKNHPDYCTYNIDEVGFDLTKTIIASLFKQKFTEIKEYFKNNSDKKISEITEIISGIESKIKQKESEKANIEAKIQETINKVLNAENLNPIFIEALNKQHSDLDTNYKQICSEIESLNSRLIQCKNQIKNIQSALNTDLKDETNNLTEEEFSEIYHIYLDKIEYYPLHVMKGTYKVYFKSGDIFYIFINKVRGHKAAYLLVDGSVDFETNTIYFKYTSAPKDSGFLIPEAQNLAINIQDIFSSEYNQCNSFVRLCI